MVYKTPSGQCLIDYLISASYHNVSPTFKETKKQKLFFLVDLLRI